MVKRNDLHHGVEMLRGVDQPDRRLTRRGRRWALLSLAVLLVPAAFLLGWALAGIKLECGPFLMETGWNRVPRTQTEPYFGLETFGPGITGRLNTAKAIGGFCLFFGDVQYCASYEHWYRLR